MIPRCSGVWAAEDSLDGVGMVIVGSAIYTRADHDDFHVYSTREIDGTRGRVTTMEGSPTTQHQSQHHHGIDLELKWILVCSTFVNSNDSKTMLALEKIVPPTLVTPFRDARHDRNSLPISSITRT
jgi:hypothetical protein